MQPGQPAAGHDAWSNLGAFRRVGVVDIHAIVAVIGGSPPADIKVLLEYAGREVRRLHLDVGLLNVLDDRLGRAVRV